MTPMFVRKSKQNMMDVQENAKHTFMDKIAKGQYREENTKCLCGGGEDVLLTDIDRYGIPFKTVICKRCGLMRANPYYSDETITEFYKEEYSPLYRELDTCDEKFWEKYVKYGEERVDWIENRVGNLTGKKVYEIGCGSGATLYCFQNRGAEVCGCDYGEKFMQFGKEKGVTILCGEWDTLKEQGKADIIVINHVLEHIKNPLEYLKDIKVLMKENALLYIGVPFISQIELGVYEYDLFRYVQNAHAWYFSEETLGAIVKAAGYEISEVRKGEYLMCTPKGEEKDFIEPVNGEYECTIQHLKTWDRVLDIILKYKDTAAQKEEQRKEVLEEKEQILESRVQLQEERKQLVEERNELRIEKQKLLQKNKEEHEKRLELLEERKKLVEEKNGLLEDRKHLREEIKELKNRK